MAFEPVGEASTRAASKLVQVLPLDSAGTVEFLNVPEVALRDDLRFPFGLELCKRQVTGQNLDDPGATILVGNRWAHEGVVLRTTESPSLKRISHVGKGPYLVRLGNGRLSPPPGGFGVACGERSAIVHHSRRSPGIRGEWTNAGVLDVLDFDTGEVERFDLSGLDSLVLTRETGIDDNRRIFSLVRDSAMLRLIVVELNRSGRP